MLVQDKNDEAQPVPMDLASAVAGVEEAAIGLGVLWDVSNEISCSTAQNELEGWALPDLRQVSVH